MQKVPDRNMFMIFHYSWHGNQTRTISLIRHVESDIGRHFFYGVSVRDRLAGKNVVIGVRVIWLPVSEQDLQSAKFQIFEHDTPEHTWRFLSGYLMARTDNDYSSYTSAPSKFIPYGPSDDKGREVYISDYVN